MSGRCRCAHLSFTVLTVLLALQSPGARAGLEERFGEMPWVYGASHIAIIHTKLGVRTLEVDMGTGKPALRGDILTVTTKLFTTENDGLKPGEHVYSNATTEEALVLDFGRPNPHAPVGLVDGAFRMRIGGKRKLVMPPSLAYGEKGNEAIGVPDTKGAPLLFYVEAIALQRAPENLAEGESAPKARKEFTQMPLDVSKVFPGSQQTPPLTGDAARGGEGTAKQGAKPDENKESDILIQAQLQRKAAERLNKGRAPQHSEEKRKERQSRKEAAKGAAESKRKEKKAKLEAKARRGADDGHTEL